MRAAFVEAARTPVSFAESVELHRWSLRCVLGRDPTDTELSLYMAKTGLETGRWTAIYNGNFGNKKMPPAEQGMFCCITLNEVLVRQGKRTLVWFAPEGELSAAPSKGGKLVAPPLPVPDGHPQTRMQAFANVYDGISRYADFVAKGRYARAWARLLAGDAVGYVHELKLAHYFTADEALYRRGVVALQNEFLAKLRKLEPPPKVDLEWEAIKLAVPQLQFDVDELLDGDFQEAA